MITQCGVVDTLERGVEDLPVGALLAAVAQHTVVGDVKHSGSVPGEVNDIDFIRQAGGHIPLLAKTEGYIHPVFTSRNDL